MLCNYIHLYMVYQDAVVSKLKHVEVNCRDIWEFNARSLGGSWGVEG